MTDNHREPTTDAAVPSEDANGGRTARAYTSGELARECGTTVRTIQFYDQKGLLAPSGYSEGGRRLFGDVDADRLRFILLMKQLGLKLSQIKGVLESPNREAILESILKEREAQLREEIAEREMSLASVGLMLSELRDGGRIVTTTKTAMDTKMNDRKAQMRWWATMIVVGILMDAAWIGTLILGIASAYGGRSPWRLYLSSPQAFG